MGKYFGTDGFRGEANVDLTVDGDIKFVPQRDIEYKQEITDEDRTILGKDGGKSMIRNPMLNKIPTQKATKACPRK